MIELLFKWALNPKVLIGVGIVIATLVVVNWLIGIGGDRARRAIDKQNERALSDAEVAELDFDECINRGWVYDFTSGKCRRSGGGN